MSNYDEKDPISIAVFIMEWLATHKQFALATVDDAGKPWVVCVNLSHDEHLNFIWKSQISTQHSQYIAKRPDIALCIFSEIEGRGDFGFYAIGTAHEVTDEAELDQAIDARFQQKGKPVPPRSDFQGEAPARLYVARIKKAWVNDDRHIKTSVDLEALRKAAKAHTTR